MKFILKIADWTHRKLFKHPLSVEGEAFIKNLSWVFFATIFAKFLMFIVQTWGGRILGPEKYGEVNLIISIGQILFVPLSLFVGGNALIKYYQESKTNNERSSYLSTATLSFLFFLFIIALLLFLFQEKLAFLFKTTPQTILLAIFFAILSSSLTYAENMLRTVLKFRVISLLQLISHLIMFILFLLLLRKNSIWVVIGPLFLQLGTYLLFSIRTILAEIKISFSSTMFWELLHFNKYAIFTSISGVVYANVDKIILNYLNGTTGVGLYQAYYFSSLIIFGTLVTIFVTVFFPTIVKFEDKKNIIKKILKVNWIAMPVIFLLTILSTILIIKYIYSYPFYLNLAIITSMLTAIFPISFVLGNISLSLGISGAKVYLIGNILQMGINIILNLILIPRFYITGAMTATLISYIFVTIYFYYKLRTGKEEI
jgi:O-antigen/teichoic acid export membrane protein